MKPSISIDTIKKLGEAINDTSFEYPQFYEILRKEEGFKYASIEQMDTFLMNFFREMNKLT